MDDRIKDQRPSHKLWEEMTTEEQRQVVGSWDAQVVRFRADLLKRYWEGQRNFKILRDRPSACVPVTPASVTSATPLPDEPGHYLWYVLDWGYLDVGMVHVLQDPPSHLAYLKQKYDEGCRGHLVYENSKGATLTMYQQCHDHHPYTNKEGVPWVDGYVPINFEIFK